MSFRTIVQAIEDAGKAEPSRGLRFLPDTGVPGFGPPPRDRGEEGASPGESWFSYGALERTSARWGGALQALGLRKGERVALILPNNDDFVLCFLGALRAGVIPVPIYPPMALGQLQSYLDNTRHIVAKSGARILVTTARIKLLLGTVQSSCPSLEDVVAVESIRESREALRPETITLDDTAFLQFTSGSTSRPKGVMLTHGNLAANIKCIMNDGLAIRREDVAISWLPLYHDMGLIGFVLAPIYNEVPVTYLSPLTFLKRPVTWFQAFTRYKGSIAYAPNFAFALCMKRIREADMVGLDVSSWRVAGCGAEPIRAETLEAFANTFAKVGFKKEALLPSYGMAESSLAIAFTELGEGVKTLTVHGATLWSEGVAKVCRDDDEESIKLVSCGPHFPDHEIGVFATDDATSAHPLAEGHVGELRIKGPSVMTKYWDDAERTRDTFAGSFLKTGDLGFIYEGHTFICGRSKEVVIVNGRNYYPQDMEWEAGKVPGVRKGNIIAFGARDPSGIERDRERVVIAFEVQDADALSRESALSADVRRAVQEGMGLTIDDAVALPSGALPKTSSGKLQRAKTRELYETGELTGRTGAKEASTLDIAKAAAVSQLNYFKLAVLGGQKNKKKD